MCRRPVQLRRRRRGFTLIELILVMTIIAIVSAAVVPALWAFATGRKAGDAAATVVAMAELARSRAASEGAVYRLNFDARAGQLWLTKQDGGVFQPAATGDGTERVSLPDGVGLSVAVTAATVAVPIARPDVQQSLTADPPPFGRSAGTPNTLVTVPHDAADGTYVEVQPSGRTDPCLIRLTDPAGHTISVGCGTATDVVHVLQPGEM